MAEGNRRGAGPHGGQQAGTLPLGRWIWRIDREIWPHLGRCGGVGRSGAGVCALAAPLELPRQPGDFPALPLSPTPCLPSSGDHDHDHDHGPRLQRLHVPQTPSLFLPLPLLLLLLLATPLHRCPFPVPPGRLKCGVGAFGFGRQLWSPSFGVSTGSRRATLRIATSFGAGTEKAFKTTVEIDRLIDDLRSAEYHTVSSHQMAQLVAENVLAFDAPFWLRLAARADLCASDDDREEYEELAYQIMSIVERIVNKTKEKIESSTDILKAIIQPLSKDDDEIVWPPWDQASLVEMRKEVERREMESFLDESFLSEVSAQLRQAKEDNDKPGLVAILQKVLQLYAACLLCKRSYAIKDGVIDKAEELLEQVLDADEDKWNDILGNGLTYGGGSVQSEDFFKAIERRIERTLMRTENGSYQQRVLAEYISEIQTRAQALIAAFQSSPPTS